MYEIKAIKLFRNILFATSIFVSLGIAAQQIPVSTTSITISFTSLLLAGMQELIILENGADDVTK